MPVQAIVRRISMSSLNFNNGILLSKGRGIKIYTKRHLYKNILRNKGIDDTIINKIHTKDLENIVKEGYV